MSAMVSYHVNDEGRNMPCSAQTPDACLYSVEDHITTDDPQAAVRFAEERSAQWAQDQGHGALSSLSKADQASSGFDIFASLAAIQQENADSAGDGYTAGDEYADIEVSDEEVRRAQPYQGNANRLPELFGGEGVGYTPNEYLFSTSTEKHSQDHATGTFKTSNIGTLAESGYFNPDTVHGTIDYRNLDDDAAETFGFARIPEYEPYVLTEHNTADMDTFFEVSRAELDQASEDEKRAADFYTGRDFRWINDSIYGKIDAPGDDQWNHDEGAETMDFQQLTSLVTEDDRKYNDTASGPPVRTASAVKRIVDTLDAAIDKGPKRQRTVYRAVKGTSSLFGGKSVGQWLDEDGRNGTEVVFEGYQSTSPKTDGIKKFAQDNGVIFEVLTPEGINVTGNGHFDDEFEVMLPRDTRYMVVGSSRHVDIDFPHTHHTAYKDSVDNMTVIRLVAINSRGEVLDGTNSDPVQPWEPKVREPAFA